MNASLRSMLISDLPAEFVVKLARLIAWAYKDTYESINADSGYGEPERKYLLPHIRRATLESKIRQIAIDCGLKVKIENNITGNTSYTLISVGMFTFTISKGNGKKQLPCNKAHFREQYAEISQHLTQCSLFEVASEPKKSSLYGIIIHDASDYDQSEVSYLKIGFLAPAQHQWVEPPIDVRDIIEAQALVIEKQNTLSIVEELKRQPRLKKHYNNLDESTKQGGSLL